MSAQGAPPRHVHAGGPPRNCHRRGRSWRRWSRRRGAWRSTSRWSAAWTTTTSVHGRMEPAQQGAFGRGCKLGGVARRGRTPVRHVVGQQDAGCGSAARHIQLRPRAGRGSAVRARPDVGSHGPRLLACRRSCSRRRMATVRQFEASPSSSSSQQHRHQRHGRGPRQQWPGAGLPPHHHRSGRHRGAPSRWLLVVWWTPLPPMMQWPLPRPPSIPSAPARRHTRWTPLEK
jgi:hypothetical protein